MRAKAYLVQESNGVWYAKYLNTETQWTKRSLETRKKSVARIKFGEFLTELDKADASRIEPMKFGSARDQYLRWVEANKARSWYIKQRQYFESTITPFFDDASYVSSITSRKIEAYAELRKKVVRGTTVNKELAALRKFCRKLVEWRYLPFNPTSNVVDLPDDSQPRVRYLSFQEYEQLLRNAEEMKTLPHFSLGLHFRFLTEYIMLGCNTGLRPSELLHLEGRDVDLPGKRLRVRRKPELGFHPKGYHERDVPLNDHAFYAAASLLEQRAQASDFLFHHRDGSRVRNARESFDTLIKRALLDEVIPYTLRHTFGAWSIKAGIHPRALQKLMGHSTLAVTERYSHVAQDDLAAAVRRIDSFLPNFLPSLSHGVTLGVADKPFGIMVPKVGVEPTWPQGPRDFESLEVYPNWEMPSSVSQGRNCATVPSRKYSRVMLCSA